MLQAAQLVAAKRPSARNTELTALRRLLTKYLRLSETAEAAHDAQAFQTWAAAAERVATTLLQHQTRQPAATAASKTTRFTVAIFDREGKPVNVIPAPVAATSGDVDVAAQPAAPEPAPALATPEQPQPESAAPPNLPPPANAFPARSLFEHPFFGSRERHGTRHW